MRRGGCGAKTCITDSIITSDVYSSGTAQLLALQAQAGEAKTSGGSRDSSGPLINYVRYPSLLLCSHTHLLTHPHSNYSFSALCGVLATVARTPQVCTHHTLLCPAGL